MLKKIRVILAAIFFAAITLLFLDFTGVMPRYFGWMAKIQFLPAVLAINVGVVVGLVIFTLLFGRVYCSVICPMGVFQDIIARIGNRFKKNKKRPYSWSAEKKWIRYGVLGLFILAIILGAGAIVALLAPYSSYGRIASSFFQPVYRLGNNLFASLSAHMGNYAFYSVDVWIKSLSTFIIAAVTLVVIVILAARGGRTYCNTICPVGTALSFFSRFAMFRPVIDPDKCKNCRQCEFKCKASCINIKEHKIDYSRCVDCFNCLDNCKFGALKYKFAYAKKGAEPSTNEAVPSQSDKGRRAFMAGTAIALGMATLKAQEKKVDGGLATIIDRKKPTRQQPITPPGSGSFKQMYNHCTGCQLCVSACPNDVLRPSSDLMRLMQPEASYERGYCRPECTRCSEVCPAGAILPIDAMGA